MADLTPAVSDWLAAHHGVITIVQLRRLGVSRKTQLRLAARGLLRQAHRSVFVIASSPATLQQRCAVLCATHPAGFITGPTAGQLAGLRRMPQHAPLHFSVRHGAKVIVEPGVHLRQTTALRADDRRERGDGITCASWARLAFDLAADLAPLDHQSVLHQLLHEHLVTTSELVAIERRLGHPARPGSGRFLRSLTATVGDPAPNESHSELRLAKALREIGVPVHHQTRVLRLPDGSAARIDLAVPELRWGIELDLDPDHRSLRGSASDAKRDRQLHLIGWQLEHVTELDLQDVRSLAGELATLYHERRRSVSHHPRVS